LNIELPYYLSLPLLGINPQTIENRNSNKTCTQKFTAALFTIAKRWRGETTPMQLWGLGNTCFSFITDMNIFLSRLS